MKPAQRGGGTAGRLRVALITTMLGLGSIWGWGLMQAKQALAATPVIESTVASIVQRMQKARGHVVVLAFYRPNSEDPYVLGDLRRWAIQTENPRVELLPVAMGSRRDAQSLFLHGMDRGIQRLPPEWLAPEEAAALDSTLTSLGVRKASTRGLLPLTVVFNPKGGIVAQWQGELEYLSVLHSAKTARTR
jgi:hypothetical protein